MSGDEQRHQKPWTQSTLDAKQLTNGFCLHDILHQKVDGTLDSLILLGRGVEPANVENESQKTTPPP